jgi:hypothetical protein
MKKLILASVSAIALFGVAACSDNTDSTTTESVNPPATEQPAPMTPAPAAPEATPPATDDTTTKSITPTPESGTSGEMQNTDPMQPKPVEPAAPAQ